MLKKLNQYSGLFTAVTFLCILVFQFTIFQTTIADVPVDIKEQKETLILIKDSLKDKTRDHREFQKSIDRTNDILYRLSIVLAKLEVKL